MFGIGLSHILLVAVIGLIFIGPEELPQVLRALAKVLGQLKRATDDITNAFHSVSEHGRDYVKEERRLMSETMHAGDADPLNQKARTAPTEKAKAATSVAAPDVSTAVLEATAPIPEALIQPAAAAPEPEKDPAQLSLNLSDEHSPRGPS